ncbi:hypothetical protein AKJ44_00305 [candidate division MSBL1 archaeon SCGC-AAA261F17]|uniref:Polymerase nucleotidyl transferase domain-containing protein n=1 Tax=candidate division MSBL1 archaeon SCGC-AAA261F17 TaxID=1698274 RepID=A0A133V7R0_9EURY|nr:hypothetical protein AKJ44_00305 [candidate division MSBL1 archaeon SCGC-AAA261F17]
MNSIVEIDDERVEKFVTCTLACHSKVKTLLIIGSAAHGELTKYSDIDGVMLTEVSEKDVISELEEDFNELAAKRFGKSSGNEFYSPHWSLFIYPEKAFTDKSIFSEYCPLPLEFTLYNLKHNSKLVFGQDARKDISVKYNEGLIDEWLSFAPKYHLTQSEIMINNGENLRKSTYALSRAILQTARGVAWKEDKNTSSSYESIVQSMKKLEHHSTNLAEWALEKRRKDFESTIRETKSKLKPAENFLDNTLKRYVQIKRRRCPYSSQKKR